MSDNDVVRMEEVLQAHKDLVGIMRGFDITDVERAMALKMAANTFDLKVTTENTAALIMKALNR